MFRLIEWKGLETYLAKLQLQKRIVRLQLIHDWQNVGRQKRKFLESSQKKKDTEKWTQEQHNIAEEGLRIEGSCPFQCGQEESHLHFMECEAQGAKQARRQIFLDTKNKLVSIGVDETIARLLVQGLSWSENCGIPSFIHIGNSTDKLITKAIESQTEIGWTNVKKGFLSKYWAEAQRQYIYYSRGQAKDWGSILVRWMVETSWKMWEVRNKMIHGECIRESRDKKIVHLQEQIMLIYRQARVLHRFMNQSERRVFRMQVNRRIQGGVILLESWYSLAEKVLEAVEKRADDRQPTKLEQWLNRKYTYQGWVQCDNMLSQSTMYKSAHILKLQ